MTFAIAGVSGRTGRIAAEELLARGERVRVIVRDGAKGAEWTSRGAEVAVADLSDSVALARALRDVEGAYLLIPPNLGTQQFRAYQDSVARSLAAAVAESRAPHVVLLSSVGAQHADGTGPIAGLHYAEKVLAAVPNTVVSSVRAAYFYENFGAALGSVKDGVLPTFFPSSLVVPMVSTRDIGRLAAELLLERPKKSQIVELGTGHTPAEIANAIGDLAGKEVRVQEAPLDAVVPVLTSAGFTRDLAGLYQEMTSAIIDGRAVFEGPQRAEHAYRFAASTEPLDRVFAALLGTGA